MTLILLEIMTENWKCKSRVTCRRSDKCMQILVGEPEGKGSLARLRRRWTCSGPVLILIVWGGGSGLLGNPEYGINDI